MLSWIILVLQKNEQTLFRHLEKLKGQKKKVQIWLVFKIDLKWNPVEFPLQSDACHGECAIKKMTFQSC